MPEYPHRKFVHISGARDADVGHPIASTGTEDYHHADLIDCSLRKHRGHSLDENVDVLAEEVITSGWLIGAGPALTVELADSPRAHRAEAIKALERWASGEFTIVAGEGMR